MEEIAKRLMLLGFNPIEILDDKKSIVTVKIRTSKGWTYEKFDSTNPDAVELWAANHQPE